MQRFYTHVRTGDESARDIEGTEHPNLTAACEQAKEEARFLIATEIQQGADEVKFEMCIEDETGAPLAALPVSAKVLGLA